MRRVILVLISMASLFFQSLQAKQTLIYCSEGSPKIFNPQLATDGPTFNASSRMLYNRLVDFKQGSTELVPSLATDWNISKDGLTYTFNLRKDVIFHQTKDFKPTRNFNADDVVFTFERMMNKNHPYHMVSGGTYEYFKAMSMDKLIASVKKIGPYKVEFKLKKQVAPFLANLAMDFASILSNEYATQMAKKNKKEMVDQKPVGTGPFIFQKYVKDTLIRYKNHTRYFDGQSKLDQVIFSINVDPSVRLQKLKTGECHIMAEPSAQDIAQIEKNKTLKVLKRPGLNIGYIAMNVEKKPFDNLKVRQAIYHTLNKENYINTIYKGQAQQAVNPIPPSMWSYDKAGASPSVASIAKAKKLLKDAGYEKGFEIELWTLPISRPYNPDGKKMGELIQADLAKIGVKVKLKTFKWATYLEKASKGEHQMIQMGWTGDNGDPDNFLDVLLGCQAVKSGSNYSRWCHKKFNQLVSEAKSSSDLKKRTELYKRAQKIFRQELPWVPIAHAKVFKAMSKKVKGYKVSPFGVENFYKVSVQ